MNDTFYFKQAKLLLNMLRFTNKYFNFALKGGTAINFFVRNLPRLSVDIDLTYVPLQERNQSLQNISHNLERLSQDIRHAFPIMKVVVNRTKDTKTVNALIVNQAGITVKIEANLVIRGTVFPTVKRQLCKQAEQKFAVTTTINTLSFGDLYGGKICAALDRQHPRDLYDVHLLLKNEGITEEVRKAFVVYLISHPRPIVELLDPNPQDFREVYFQEFEGMTFDRVPLDDLVETQKYLNQKMKNILTTREKQFLISFKSLAPDCDLLGLENIQELPAVKWKLLNLQKMDKKKHRKALDKLKDCLEM